MQKFQLFTALLVVLAVARTLAYPHEIETERVAAQTKLDETAPKEKDMDGPAVDKNLRLPEPSIARAESLEGISMELGKMANGSIPEQRESSPPTTESSAIAVGTISAK